MNKRIILVLFLLATVTGPVAGAVAAALFPRRQYEALVNAHPSRFYVIVALFSSIWVLAAGAVIFLTPGIRKFVYGDAGEVEL